MPHDDDARVHPADRDYYRARMGASAIFSGIAFLVAVAQLVAPDIPGSRPNRFLIFAALSAALLIPYPLCVWRSRRRIVVRADGLVFRRGKASAFVGWGDVAEIYPSEHVSDVLGVSSEELREAAGTQRDLRLRFVTRGGVRYVITNEFLGVESLIATIVTEASARHREAADAALRSGESVEFGPLGLSARGLSLVHKPRGVWSRLGAVLDYDFSGPEFGGPPRIGFDEVESVRTEVHARGPRAGYRLVIRRDGAEKPWLIAPIDEIPNFAVLTELLDRHGCPVESRA